MPMAGVDQSDVVDCQVVLGPDVHGVCLFSALFCPLVSFLPFAYLLPASLIPVLRLLCTYLPVVVRRLVDKHNVTCE